MIRSIAAAFTAAWSIFGVQSGYGQPPSEEGKIYWTNSESGIYRSGLDGSNVERIVIPDLRRPDNIALDVARGKMYWTDRGGDLYCSNLDGSNVETLIDLGWGAADLALDIAEGKIYWIQGALMRANLDGSNIEKLSEYDAGSFLPGIALDLVRGKVYWTDIGAIERADLDGKNREIVVGSYLNDLYDLVFDVDFYDLALDVEGGKIYWTDSKGSILRADLDGENGEEILTGLAYPRARIALDVEGGKIYWTDWTASEDVDRGKIYWIDWTASEKGTFHRANLDGTNIEYLMEWERATGFALDPEGRKMYWTDVKGATHRANIDGSNIEHLFAPALREPYGIALDPVRGKMYWTDLGLGFIHQANLDGSNRRSWITGLARPRGILLAGDKLYWADSGTGKIQAANVDGSQIEEIGTGLDNPNAIALDQDRDKIYWTEAAAIQRSNLDGSQVEEIATVHSSLGIALDQDRDKIYYTNLDTVFRSNLDGSHIENIAIAHYWGGTGGGWNEAIALDPIGRKIYWTALHIGHSSVDPFARRVHSEIFRSNLDGSSAEQIQSMGTGWLSGPIGIALIQRGVFIPAALKEWLSGPTGIALYIPHPTSISTPSTTPAIPTTSGLDPNFPNPFNAHTQIAYRLAAPGLVRLAIYNVLGQPVRVLVNQFQPAGFYQVPWDARDQQGTALAAGVYLTRLRHPDGTQTRRLLYLK